MADPSIHCPECGAPATFRGTAISVVCEYCGSTIVRTGADVRLIGKVSAVLDQGSPILLGGRGAFERVPFEIVGRLQLRHARGLWSEWYLLFADGSDGWLADAQGSYYLVRKVAASDPRGLEFGHLWLGDEARLQERSLRVVERRVATYQGAEGSLPFEATPERGYASVDLMDEDGRFATLDYSDDDAARERPVVYFGRAVELPELGLRPLRRFEGWDG
ncbi:MAG: DUF4178 domain-containing protein [Nannocystaceae bacterium]